jgi:hypothetical protein
MFNLLTGCKSVASLSATRKQYKDRMLPIDHHYLFNIAEEMQSQLQGALRAILFACMWQKSVFWCRSNE